MYAGDDASEVGEKDFDDFGASVTLLNQLADARLADGDQGEFGCGEEGVDAYQRQDCEELQGDHC